MKSQYNNVYFVQIEYESHMAIVEMKTKQKLTHRFKSIRGESLQFVTNDHVVLIWI